MKQLVLISMLFYPALYGSPVASTPAKSILQTDILKDPLVIDAMKNFQWQWDNCKDGSNFKVNINGLVIYNSGDNYSVFSALERKVKGPGDDGFNMLLNGQRHNACIQAEYRNIMQKYGAELFWELVCSSSDARHPANLSDARANIDWLRGHNSSSYLSAKRDFSNKQYVSAMYWLMWGQRHNPSIQETFRGTFRDQRDNFIKLSN